MKSIKGPCGDLLLYRGEQPPRLGAADCWVYWRVVGGLLLCPYRGPEKAAREVFDDLCAQLEAVARGIKPVEKIVERSILAHLEVRCAECGGSGEITSPEWVEWNRQFDKAKKKHRSVKDALQAAGDYPTCPERITCGHCRGGMVLTEDGKALLHFLARHKDGPNPVTHESNGVIEIAQPGGGGAVRP